MSSNAESLPRTKRDLGIDAQRSAMAARRDHFLSLFDFNVGHGLEIGPLDAGIADPDRHDVSYVDVFDAAGLRAHYADDANVITELIPEVDFPLIEGDVTRTIEEAAGPKAPYDWVIASHVIEHVPDVIGWLREIADITVEGGALVLAVPDRRYSFDRLRPPTTIGESLEAHERGDRRPTTRAIYDHFSLYVPVDTVALWRGQRPPARAPLTERLSELNRHLERARAGEYVDCHVWMFTPESFVQLLVELRTLGLSEWHVETLLPVPRGVEFHAVLRRVPAGKSPEDFGFSEAEGDRDLPDWLDDEWTNSQTVRELKKQVARLQRRNRRLRSRIDGLEGSTRMRVGSALVAPLAAVRRSIRRR
jgi:SAM-dependent methyltransferase